MIDCDEMKKNKKEKKRGKKTNEQNKKKQVNLDRFFAYVLTRILFLSNIFMYSQGNANAYEDSF